MTYLGGRSAVLVGLISPNASQGFSPRSEMGVTISETIGKLGGVVFVMLEVTSLRHRTMTAKSVTVSRRCVLWGPLASLSGLKKPFGCQHRTAIFAP